MQKYLISAVVEDEFIGNDIVSDETVEIRRLQLDTLIMEKLLFIDLNTINLHILRLP